MLIADLRADGAYLDEHVGQLGEEAEQLCH